MVATLDGLYPAHYFTWYRPCRLRRLQQLAKPPHPLHLIAPSVHARALSLIGAGAAGTKCPSVRQLHLSDNATHVHTLYHCCTILTVEWHASHPDFLVRLTVVPTYAIPLPG